MFKINFIRTTNDCFYFFRSQQGLKKKKNPNIAHPTYTACGASGVKPCQAGSLSKCNAAKKSESQIYDLTVVEVIFKLGGDNLEYFWMKLLIYTFSFFFPSKICRGNGFLCLINTAFTRPLSSDSGSKSFKWFKRESCSNPNKSVGCLLRKKNEIFIFYPVYSLCIV